ncbi:DNA repair and recombination protein RAD54B [Larimichthys crocea]|uniref:Uncharacterized protein n=1 Tax=Larimichthys crocea TaxID=215358 RepID=A0ACD3QXH6_LARCR|nr:DNA repair and recombination protein RAD54B [Larimichthys crocea]
MRRSGAPSQLLGNASKKPRFVAPGPSSSCLTPESKPLTPKLGLSNALEKVQRSLAAPAQSKTEYEAQPKAAQPATALSKALARVLCATESKENEAKTEDPNNGSEEYTEDSGPAGVNGYPQLTPGLPRAPLLSVGSSHVSASCRLGLWLQSGRSEILQCDVV